MIKLSKETQLIIEKLNSCGFKAYIVGGCVRDYLMGLTPSDIDITTNAKPEETKEVFSDFRVIETGIKHGTVSVLVNGRQFEVTTFRIDSEYSDNRHPDCFSFYINIKGSQQGGLYHECLLCLKKGFLIRRYGGY